MSLPARPLCPSRLVLTVASPCTCSVTYNAGLFQGKATCEISRVQAGVSQETCRCRPGEILSLTVTLPNAQRIKVSEADVRWSRSQELAVEHMAMEPHIHGRVQ